jgi:hypothetical protein
LYFEMSAMNFIIVKPEITYPEFIRLLTEQFPSVAADVLDESYRDLPHLQVSFLAAYANQCLATDQLAEFGRAIRFFQQTVDKVDSLVENALSVSFLEYLEIGGQSESSKLARSLLTPEQLATWVALQKFGGISPDIA